MIQDPLVKPIVIVSATDEALDMTAAERAKYAAERSDTLLRVVPGATPIRFHVRPLGASEANGVDAQPTINAKAMMAFALGVLVIEGANEHGPSALDRILPSHRTPRPGGGERMVWSDEQLDALQELLGRATLLEVGAFIFERTLRGKKAASGSVRYTVPHSLLDALAQMPVRRAEAPSDGGSTASG